MRHDYNAPLGDLETMIYLSADSMDAIYDNSRPFSTFLKNQGIDRILSDNNLKLRKNHKLVPHVRLAVRDLEFTMVLTRPFHSAIIPP